MGSLAIAVQEKKIVLTPFVGFLNWTDIKILSKEPKLLYLNFALYIYIILDKV